MTFSRQSRSSAGASAVGRPLPHDLSALSQEELELERAARDRRLTPLFRRWPSLSEPELGELKRVHAERLRLARHVGLLRRRRRSSSPG
jgi:hypothetical protein